MMNDKTHCSHTGFWSSHPPVPIQVQNGALLVTSLYCTNCGHVEYRSPPLNRQDETALQKRMEEFNEKNNSGSTKELSLPHKKFEH